VVVEQAAQLAEDKAEQMEAILFSQPLRLQVVDTAVDGELLEELPEVLAVLVVVGQKIVAQQEALEILHQHHQPKELMAAQLLLVVQKVVPVVEAHL
jgi:hypothetical protein